MFAAIARQATRAVARRAMGTATPATRVSQPVACAPGSTYSTSANFTPYYVALGLTWGATIYVYRAKNGIWYPTPQYEQNDD
eukprot:m.45006 g.45006  ORF g.45006 m.45006 type:complete len:82 (-) comp12147_c0_seq2:914-1159(-)